MRDQTSMEQQIPGSGNVVAGFIPEIRQTQKGSVQDENRYKNDREYQRRVCACRRRGEMSGRAMVQSLPPASAVGMHSWAPRWLEPGECDQFVRPKTRPFQGRRNALLMYRPGRRQAGIEFDLAERAFVADHVLLK